MKTLMSVLLAGAALTLCGCATDSPIFANDATKAAKANGSTVAPGSGVGSATGPSNAEVVRDLVNIQNSGASMGDQVPNAANKKAEGEGQLQSMNPYGH
jgi:hypothetical protein